VTKAGRDVFCKVVRSNMSDVGGSQ
jgi:hypothetical protein